MVLFLPHGARPIEQRWASTKCIDTEQVSEVVAWLKAIAKVPFANILMPIILKLKISAVLKKTEEPLTCSNQDPNDQHTLPQQPWHA